jgi:hypothetical protein
MVFERGNPLWVKAERPPAFKIIRDGIVTDQKIGVRPPHGFDESQEC